MVIGDEMLTPDSSRFWPADGYEPGHGQPSFDKQFARDWLKANDGSHDWTLPQEIVDKTIEKYLQAYEMLTGNRWHKEHHSVKSYRRQVLPPVFAYFVIRSDDNLILKCVKHVI